MEHNYRYTGLTAAQVQESRSKHGTNLLTPPQKKPWWKLLLKNFTDPLIVILLVAGCLSVGVSFYEYYAAPERHFSVFFEPIGIFVAILLATVLSFLFEHKADKEFALLNKVNDDDPVTVIRENGNTMLIPKRDVVVGDIVVLSTGDEVPADGEVLETVILNVDESSLTGEPIAHKSEKPEDADTDATYPTNMVLRGTKVMEGHGVIRVTAVGDSTENGKVVEEIHIDDSVKTPLDEQLSRLGRVISIFSYSVAALVVAGRMLMFFINNPDPTTGFHLIAYSLQTLMIAVALIVVAVPEGLPMAVTLSLAYSMRRMLKNNNLVRKLHACETMGAATVICTDKTGTLTRNQMSVNTADFFGIKSLDDKRMRVIDEGIAVNSTATLDLSDPSHPKALGNPTEGALLLWLHKLGIDYSALRSQARRLGELPFTTERKYMATIVESTALPGKRVLYIKGAPEIVLKLCSEIEGGVTKEEISKRLLGFQEQGMRTLGFAYCVLPEGSPLPVESESIKHQHLTYLGIVAIADPVRPDVAAAVAECTGAGIKVKIVTGDTPATAKEIARQIGLWTDADGSDNIITGPELGRLSPEELDRRVGDLKIIARARPLDKKRLVESLQRNGEVVAVTGDGTNDAPALKAAQVGLSMGDGTSVAKEASDITIIDNSFTSIGKAVMWGRSLYRNIQRFLLFQLNVNVVACLTVLVGAFMGTDSPLTVTQMLWVNLIMDTFAAVALSTLPPSERVMRDKPRSRSAFIITKTMWWYIFGVGIAMFAALCAMLADLQHGSDWCRRLFDLAPDESSASNLTIKEQTIFFTTFVMMQFWNLLNVKAYATGASAFRFAKCGEFMLIASLVVVGQLLIVNFGGELFNVTRISLHDWIVIIVGTSPVLLIGEVFRLLRNRH